MTSTELQIKNIVYEEFSKLISNIEGDFKTNFVKKRYNFLLSQLDETITANMVFVSSFESKSGFAIETCAKRIAIQNVLVYDLKQVADAKIFEF